MHKTLMIAAFLLLGVQYATGEETNYLSHLAPIVTQPKNLLCEKPQKYGLQYIACDAYALYREPILPATRVGSTKLAIRVVYVPSFHTWSVVRAELSAGDFGKEWTPTFFPEGTITVSTQTEDGSRELRSPHEPDSKTPYIRTFKLSAEEAMLILENVDLADGFATLSPPKEVRDCIDGTNWIVEMAESNRYHWTELGCNYQNDPHAKSLYQLASLLALIVRSYTARDLKEFPGS